MHNDYYRLAGADANPYLVMATILTGMLYGLEQVNDTELPEILNNAPVLPLFNRTPSLSSPNATTSRRRWALNFRYWFHSRLMELSAFEGIVTAEETHFPS